MKELFIELLGKPLGIVVFQLLDASQFTIYLSLIAFFGGGIIALPITILRIAPKRLLVVGVKLELVPVTSKQRIPFLETKKVDLVISSMGANPGRAKSIWFSSAYAPFFSGAFASKDMTITGVGDLAGKKVGLTGGTLEDLELTASAPKSAQIIRFGDNAASLAAYVSKQVDVLVTGNTVAAKVSADHPELMMETKFIIKESPAFIGIRKGEFDMLQWVNVFILHKTLGGDLNKLSIKWLGQKLPTLPTL